MRIILFVIVFYFYFCMIFCDEKSSKLIRRYFILRSARGHGQLLVIIYISYPASPKKRCNSGQADSNAVFVWWWNFWIDGRLYMLKGKELNVKFTYSNYLQCIWSWYIALIFVCIGYCYLFDASFGACGVL